MTMVLEDVSTSAKRMGPNILHRLKAELASPTALLDPEAERVLEESRDRVVRPLTGRERIGETVAAATFTVAAVAVALLLDTDREASPGLYMFAVAAYAFASRVTFDVGASRTDCTQLVLVPMLVLLPPTYVPLLVAAGYLLGELPDYVLRRRHPDRILVSLGNAWYVVGPALVLWVAGSPGPGLEHWPVYLAALGAQFLFDTAATTPREWFELGVPPRMQVHGAAWTFAVDALLSPVALLVAVGSADHPYTFLLVTPLIGLFAMFAGERRARLANAAELGTAYRGTTMVLADLVQSDDEYTGLHSRTVVSLAVGVAERMGLDAHRRRNVEFGALLHDVGKIAVPKEIINKPAPLTEQEWSVVRMHTVEGQRLLDRVGGVLRDVGAIVRASHERWDGTGYPDRLAGTAIPLEARIVSCCDAFNAMTTDRPYRSARSIEAATAELRAHAGSQFDPAVVEALADLVEFPVRSVARATAPKVAYGGQQAALPSQKSDL
jgi:HD-GYP domain-containing protein (c-di-GMP phosphodiesterase class II)